MSLARDIFLAPGRVLTWWDYMFPQRGQLWASARRKDSPLVQALFSAAFWAGLAVVLVMAAAPSASRSPTFAAAQVDGSKPPDGAVAAEEPRLAAASPAAEPANAASREASRPVEVAGDHSAPAGVDAPPSADAGVAQDPELQRAIEKALDSGEPTPWRSAPLGADGYAVASASRSMDRGVCRNVVFTVRQGRAERRSGDRLYCRTEESSGWVAR